jgi:hypothetical protein
MVKKRKFFVMEGMESNPIEERRKNAVYFLWRYAGCNL